MIYFEVYLISLINKGKQISRAIDWALWKT